ncbi:MAG TPA: hypothetical protein VGK64_16210 [Bryobacteraceae bacterium]
MHITLARTAVTALVMAAVLAAAEKPRVFITESAASKLSGNGSVGQLKGSLAFTGGTSPQNVEVMKTFSRKCRDVIVTANRDKADYIVRLDHEPINPTTPFVHGNKVAVFDKDEDLIYSDSSRLLGSAVKGACSAITNRSTPKR